MSEPLPFYSAGVDTTSKVVEWHCVTDSHGEGCGATMGHIMFAPTRLLIGLTWHEPHVIIRGDAEILCPRCGKWQDWHWEREHPLWRNKVKSRGEEAR